MEREIMAKILIVEDEKAINDLLKLNLEMVGHQCVPALTGKEAIRAAVEGIGYTFRGKV